MAGSLVRPVALFLLGTLAAVASAAEPGIPWLTDYATALKAAEKQKRPLLTVVGSDACTHCRRMEADTFADEKVRAAVVGKVIPLKIDATKEPALVQALNVQAYPTCILAGADGTIHGYWPGYQSADDFRARLAKAVEAATRK